MASRSSRFTTTKTKTKEIRALPILNGDVSVYANPVDTYLSCSVNSTIILC